MQMLLSINALRLLVHIWEYKGYPGHHNTQARLAQDPVCVISSKRSLFSHTHFFLMQVYQEFLKQLRPLLVSRENNVMLEFSFWQTSPPMVTDGIYELRKYNLKVSECPFFYFNLVTHLSISLSLVDCLNGKRSGKCAYGKQDYVILIHRHRRKGLECRRQFCEPVGAWFSQLGQLHTTYHMWTYP